VIWDAGGKRQRETPVCPIQRRAEARPRGARGSREGGAVIAGEVRGREVLLYAPLILRCYGLRVWWRCLRASWRREQTTFLDIAMGRRRVE